MIRLECGCTVQLLSYELDREKWGGSALHRMHFDEEPPEELYEEAQQEHLAHEADRIHAEEAAERGETPAKKPWWKFWA